MSSQLMVFKDTGLLQVMKRKQKKWMDDVRKIFEVPVLKRRIKEENYGLNTDLMKKHISRYARTNL